MSDRLITDRVRAVDFQQRRAKVYASGGCAKPIKLVGSGSLVHQDGTVIYQRSGELFAPCGNRRSSVCPACADRYASDAFHLLRAGLSGGGALDTDTNDYVGSVLWQAHSGQLWHRFAIALRRALTQQLGIRS